MPNQEYEGGAGKPLPTELASQRQAWLARLAAEPNDELQLALDDMVLDLCASSITDTLNSTDDDGDQEDIISGSEKKASDINNSGPAGQIDFILTEYGEAEGHKILAELFSHGPNGPRPNG